MIDLNSNEFCDLVGDLRRLALLTSQDPRVALAALAVAYELTLAPLETHCPEDAHIVEKLRSALRDDNVAERREREQHRVQGGRLVATLLECPTLPELESES